MTSGKRKVMIDPLRPALINRAQKEYLTFKKLNAQRTDINIPPSK